MLKVAIAHSLELDTKDAIEDVLKQCQTQLGDRKPQVGILFTHNECDFQLVLDKIYDTYPGLELIGGTTEAEISSIHGYADDSIVLTLFCSDNLEFKAGIFERISKVSNTECQEAIEKTKSGMKQEPNICLIIPCLSFMVGKDLKLNNIELV